MEQTNSPSSTMTTGGEKAKMSQNILLAHLARISSMAVTSCVGLLTLLVLYKAIATVIPSTDLYGGLKHDAAFDDTRWFPPKSARQSSNVMGKAGLAFDYDGGKPDMGEISRNWCNERHIAPSTYSRAPSEYELVYVEVIHRHHRRTPYAANLFPTEEQTWDCSDIRSFHFSRLTTSDSQKSADTYWKLFESNENPFTAHMPPGDCQFPQITREGLEDSWAHGKDLYGVYHDIVGLIPDERPEDRLSFRVTNNVITSQVASMVVHGMFGVTSSYPLHLQPRSIDSLEPAYSCPAADELFHSYGVGSSNPAWTIHLEKSSALFNDLDEISGVSPAARDWHSSWDHYFDNLSSRLCHKKPLPCKIAEPEKCVTREQAEEVFSLGEFEYSFLYREAVQSLTLTTARFGVWINELAKHLEEAASGQGSNIVYRHNVAHDGSVANLLSILQVDDMGWPGMGSEVAFELYRKQGSQYFVRILWQGQSLHSSLPFLKESEFVNLVELLAYFKSLVGENASLIPHRCAETT